MADTTPLGLTKLLPGQPQSVNDYAFGTTNLDIIDRLIRMMMDHRHNSENENLATPGPPDVAESGTEGQLRAGATYFYRVAEVHGVSEVESPAGPSSWVTISGGLEAPEVTADDVTISTAGGSLLPGIYSYAFTVYDTYPTYDTNCPAPVSVNLAPADGAEQQVTFDLPALPAGASGWNVYRRVPGAVYFYLIDTLVGDAGTYVDDGSATDGSPTLQPNNRSGWPRAATITKPDGVTGDWVVYRSTRDDDWTATQLATVSSAFDTYLDLGNPTTFQAPYDIPVGYSNPGPVSGRELGFVPHVETFRTSGAPATGSIGEWVVPFDAEIAGVTAFLDRGTTPTSQDLIVDLEAWDPDSSTWEQVAGMTATIDAAESQSANVSGLTTPVALASGTRVRLNVTQVGSAGTDLVVLINTWGHAESWPPPTRVFL